MNEILLSLFLVIALMGTAWANNGWYSTLQGTASDVEQTPPPNGVTIAYNTTDHQWEFNYGLSPAGGTTGTCLEKNSNSDYDYSWQTCGSQWTTSGNDIYNSNSGNVGIGTINPSATLQVTGSTSPLFRIDALIPTPSQIAGYTSTTNNNEFIGTSSGNIFYEGQTFTLSSLTTITGLAIKLLANQGSPSGTMTCGVFNVSGSTPTGTTPGSGTLANSNLTAALTPTPSAVNSVTFATPAALSSGLYAIECYSTSSQSSGNWWNLADTSTNPYSGGSQWFNNSGTWTNQSGGIYDWYFQVIGYAGSTNNNSPLYVDNNVNVGLAQTAPINILDVNTNGKTGIVVGNSADNYSGVTSAPVNGMLVEGNVGIGSFNPKTALDLGSGSLTTTGNATVNTLNYTTLNPAIVPVNYWTLQSTGNIGISTIQNVGIGTTFVGGTGEGALSVMNGNVGIGTWIPSGTLQVGKGTTSMTVFSSGNVGIGTSVNPAENLYVNGAQVNNNIIELVNTTGNSLIEEPILGGAMSIFTVGSSSSTQAGTLTLEGGARSEYSGGSVTLTGSGSANAGGVSINSGTSSANAGPITITASSASGGGGDITLTSGGQTTGTSAILNLYGAGTTSAGGSFQLNTGTSNTSGTSGNVGIGIPYQNSGGNTTGRFLMNVGIGTFTQTATAVSITGGDSFNVGSNINMLAVGNVGIGTTTPPNPLYVKGTSIFIGNIGVSTATPGQSLDVNGTVRDIGEIVNGNVGIGSTNPGQALDVNGTVRALTAGACTTLYECVGGVDAGVIQTSACVLCPASTCVAMNGCF